MQDKLLFPLNILSGIVQIGPLQLCQLCLAIEDRCIEDLGEKIDPGVPLWVIPSDSLYQQEEHDELPFINSACRNGRDSPGCEQPYAIEFPKLKDYFRWTETQPLRKDTFPSEWPQRHLLEASWMGLCNIQTSKFISCDNSSPEAVLIWFEV